MELKKEKGEESGLFQRFAEHIRRLLFNTAHNLLHFKAISIWKFFFLQAVFSLQYLHFPFYVGFKKFWKENVFYDILSIISKICTLFPYVDNLSWSTHLAIFHCVGALLPIYFLIIGYAQHLYGNSSKELSWLWQILSMWNSLIITIFFIPILGLLLSVMDCSLENGVYYHTYHSDFQCFSGEHNVHVVISIFYALIFIVTCTFTALLFYEHRSNIAYDVTSRQHSHAEVWEIVSRGVLCVFLILSKWSGGEWLLAIIMFAGKGVLLIRYYAEGRYYDPTAERLWRCFCLLQFWIALVFCYQLLFQNFENSGGTEIMLLCIPLVIASVMMERDKYWEVLIYASHQTVVKEEVYIKILNAYMNILALKDTEKEEEIALRGFALMHQKECTKPDCFFTHYFYTLLGRAVKITDSESMAKSYHKIKLLQNQMLLSFGNTMFSRGFGLYPKCSQLSLNYIMFLIDKFKNSTLALAKISELESNNPDLETQFLLYRYRTIIREELIDSKKNDSDKENVSAVIAYESQLNVFMEKIERVSTLHLHIWSLLLDESPDLLKILRYGFRVEQLIEEIEGHWERIQEVNPNVPQTLRIYSMFISDILNDKESGKAMMERARDYNLIKTTLNRRRQQAMNTSNISVVSPDGTPCVYISGQQNMAGSITQCNLAFCKIFGYLKKDLLGQSINILMPDIYSKYHQDILLKHIQLLMHGEASDVTTQDKFLFGKNKSNYIFPFFLRIFSTPSLLNNSNYIGLVQLDNKTMNSDTVFFLLDKRNEVCYMNSGAIAVFGLQEYMVRYSHLNIFSMCPEYPKSTIGVGQSSSKEVSIKCFLPDLSCLETTTITETSEISSLKKTPCEEKKKDPGLTMAIKNEELSEDLNMKVQKKFILAKALIEKIDISEIGTIGYYVKLEINQEQTEKNMLKEVRFPKFQFRYEENLNLFVREDRSKPQFLEKKMTLRNQIARMASLSSRTSKDQQKEEPLQSKISDVCETGSNFLNTLLPKIKQIFKYFEKNHPEDIKDFSSSFFHVINNKCPTYSDGIVTYRMVNGVLQEVSDDPNAGYTLAQEIGNDLVSDDYSEGSKSENSRKSAFLIANNIRSRKSLENILSEGKQSENTALIYLSYAFFIGLVVLATIDYVYLTKYFKYFENHMNLIALNYQRVIHEQVIMYNTRELLVLKNGYFTKYQNYYSKNLSEYFNYRKGLLAKEAQSLFDVHKNVIESTLEMENSEKYAAYNTERNLKLQIQVNSSYTITEIRSLTEAVMQLISSIITISNMEYDQILESNHDLSYSLWNGMNEIVLGLVRSALKYMIVFQDLVSEENPLFLGLLLGALGLTVITLVVSSFLIHSIEKSKAYLYSLFLEIPPQYIKVLHSICEAFVILLQCRNSSNSLESDSEVESIIDNEDQIMSRYYTIRRKRRFKNVPKFIRVIFICFIVGLIICSSFFSVDYGLYVNYRNRALDIIPVFNRTMRVSGTLYTFFNIDREYFYNSSSIVEGQSAFSEILNHINTSYERVSYIHNLRSSLKQILDSSSFSHIEKILYYDLCKDYNPFSSLEACYELGNGVAKQGISSVLSYFFVLIRTSIEEYSILDAKGLGHSAFDLETMYTQYIVMDKLTAPTFKDLQAYIVSGMKTTYNNLNNVRLGMLVAYFCIIFIFIAIIWAIYLAYLNGELIKTRKLLAIVPIDVMLKVRKLHDYLEEKALQNRSDSKQFANSII